MTLRTEAQVLEGAQLAINNTEKSEERQKRMGAYGFTAKRIEEGKVLLANALLLQDVQVSHYEDRWVIAHQLNADRQAAHAMFKEHVGVTRTAFRNEPVILHSLKIQRIAKGKWEWPQQALYFYTKLEEHIAQMEPFGINQEVIVQASTSIQALIAMKEDRFHKKGLAEDSTQEKRKAFKALKEWVLEFRSVARIAFKSNPQMLGSYGISVSSKV